MAMAIPGGGGGGGALRYWGGYIRSLSILKNTPKALISRPKKHPYLKKKRWLFPVKKHSFYQNTDIGWTGTRILTFDVIIRCLFSGSSSGSRLGSPVTSGVSRRQSHLYLVDCKGMFIPPLPLILRTWVQQILLQNRGHAEVLKKTPSSAKYVTRVRPPSVPKYGHIQTGWPYPKWNMGSITFRHHFN